MGLGGCLLQFLQGVLLISLQWAEDKGKSFLQGPSCALVCPLGVCRGLAASLSLLKHLESHEPCCVSVTARVVPAEGRNKVTAGFEEGQTAPSAPSAKVSSSVLCPCRVTIGELARVFFKVGGWHVFYFFFFFFFSQGICELMIFTVASRNSMLAFVLSRWKR